MSRSGTQVIHRGQQAVGFGAGSLRIVPSSIWICDSHSSENGSLVGRPFLVHFWLHSEGKNDRTRAFHFMHTHAAFAELMHGSISTKLGKVAVPGWTSSRYPAFPSSTTSRSNTAMNIPVMCGIGECIVDLLVVCLFSWYILYFLEFLMPNSSTKKSIHEKIFLKPDFRIYFIFGKNILIKS